MEQAPAIKTAASIAARGTGRLSFRRMSFELGHGQCAAQSTLPARDPVWAHLMEIGAEDGD